MLLKGGLRRPAIPARWIVAPVASLLELLLEVNPELVNIQVPFENVVEKMTAIGAFEKRKRTTTGPNRDVGCGSV